MRDEIAVFIADDHPVVRSGLRHAIEAEPSLRVVGEASNGRTALEQTRVLRPDVLVLDISMPEMDGFVLAEEVRRAGLDVKLIFLSVHRESEFFSRAFAIGANGYVLKDSALNEIVTGIREVMQGRCYISPAVTTFLVEDRRRTTRLQPLGPGIEDLTRAERGVLEKIAEYKTSSEIGEELHVSPRTVDTHRANICTKLDLRGKHALMKFALAHRDELSSS
jgi:DNA-binding NarL/FixJ family response regulator